jgi:hypothetical protein
MGERGIETQGSKAEIFSQRLRDRLSAVREQTIATLEVGRAVAVTAQVFALVSLFNWCPRCGQWMGAGSEGVGPGALKPEVPPPPARLLKAIGVEIRGEPTSTESLPKRHGNKLTSDKGILERLGKTEDHRPAKHRYGPTADSHGRKVDTFYDGFPEPDSRPHAHLSEFARGDNERIPLYHRPVNGPPIYDNGVLVVHRAEDNVYVWVPKEVE